jgi:hypothetical protein
MCCWINTTMTKSAPYAVMKRAHMDGSVASGVSSADSSMWQSFKISKSREIPVEAMPVPEAEFKLLGGSR